MYFNTLVDVATVAEALDRPDWVVFDCRFSLADPGRGRVEYDAGHIPGAIYAHLDQDLAGPKRPDSGRHPLPDAGQFGRWLGASGVGNDSQVVVYDANGGMFAVRLWWMLRWLGHHRVAVLDGGWQAWTRPGHPTSTSAPEPRADSFVAQPNDDMWARTDEIARVVKEENCRLIDARAHPRFTGVEETIDPVAGHVPGAVNQPLGNNLDPEGRFLPAEALKQRYQSLVEDCQAHDIVHMCGSGVTACHNMLAMEIAGWPGTRLYVGSWSEWITDPDRPIARGPE